MGTFLYYVYVRGFLETSRKRGNVVKMTILLSSELLRRFHIILRIKTVILVSDNDLF